MNVAIVGTGYSSVELFRLLLKHPEAKILQVMTHSQGGKEIGEIYPHLASILNQKLEEFSAEKMAEELDLVFLGTPAGVSGEVTPLILQKGIKVIDLSGDFRLRDDTEYERWYGIKAHRKMQTEAVYGLSEIYRDRIKKADLIANPGCYPTATLLALYPAIKEGLILSEGIIVDAKSGVSGAGRGIHLGGLYAEVNENLKAYKIGRHQHIPEIEQELSHFGEKKMRLTFIPHLVPMTRGILVTIYGSVEEGITNEQLHDLYLDYYAKEPFIRVKQPGESPATKNVAASNFCEISTYVDERSGTAIFFAAIDNLVKGAAGQAVQNMNLMFGMDERIGLGDSPVFP